MNFEPDRRTFLRSTAAVTATSVVGLAGCLGGAATGTLATRVSDRPGDIGDFQSCVVTITEVTVKPTDGEAETHDVEDGAADLTELQGEKSTLVDELELETGEYDYLQLTVPETTATLDDGSDASVRVPGDAPLKFNKAFEIREGERTSFTADFTPVKAGNSGRYNLQPVAEEVTVTYEDASAEAPSNESANTTTNGTTEASTNTTTETS